MGAGQSQFVLILGPKQVGWRFFTQAEAHHVVPISGLFVASLGKQIDGLIKLFLSDDLLGLRQPTWWGRNCWRSVSSIYRKRQA